MDIFNIQGSGENEYKVHVAPKGDDGITIHCDCRAGIFGKMCKHKLAVVTGDASMLVKPDELSRLVEISSKIAEREIGQLMKIMEAARKDNELTKRKLNKARKAVEKAMKA